MRDIITKLEELNVEVVTEGYEKQVLNVCKAEGIDCSFRDGNLHLDKEDMSAAREAIKDADMEVPKMIAEGLGDMAHEAEKDHEVQMARSDLYKSAKYAVAIHKMLKDHSEMDGIDGWVAAKITKAADYLGSVKHYMEGEAMSDVELAVVPVAGDMTDAMDVPQESVEEVHESLDMIRDPLRKAVAQQVAKDIARGDYDLLDELMSVIDSHGYGELKSLANAYVDGMDDEDDDMFDSVEQEEETIEEYSDADRKRMDALVKAADIKPSMLPKSKPNTSTNPNTGATRGAGDDAEYMKQAAMANMPAQQKQKMANKMVTQSKFSEWGKK